MTQPNDSPNPASPPPPPPAGTIPPAGTVPPPIPPQAPAPTSVQDVRTLAMLAHVLNFTLIGPLVIYLVKKGSDPFLDEQAKESLNFALLCFIAHIAISFLGIVPLGWFIHVLLGFVHLGITVAQLVFGIQFGLKAKDGIGSKYPVQIKLIA